MRIDIFRLDEPEPPYRKNIRHSRSDDRTENLVIGAAAIQGKRSTSISNERESTMLAVDAAAERAYGHHPPEGCLLRDRLAGQAEKSNRGMFLID